MCQVQSPKSHEHTPHRGQYECPIQDNIDIEMIVRGVIFLVFLALVAFSVWIYMMPIAMLLLFLHSKRLIRFRRKILSFLAGRGFLDFAAYLLATFGDSKSASFCRTKLYIYSHHQDLLDDPERLSVIICNHRCVNQVSLSFMKRNHYCYRTRIDWMYASWCYGAILGANERMIVILKDSLRSVPIFGWSMQLMHYLFLSRRRDQDIPYLARGIAYLLRTMPSSPIIVIFPEGTDLSESNVQRSHAFSSSSGLVNLNEVLYPKSGGLFACLHSLQEMHLDSKYLHDLTIAYKPARPGVRPSEKSLLKGKSPLRPTIPSHISAGEFPQEVHLFVDRYEVSALPAERSELDKWLRESFYRKEALLREFNRQISSSGAFAPPSSPLAAVPGLCASFVIPPRLAYPQPHLGSSVALVAGAAGCVILGLLYSSWIRWCVTVSIILAVTARFFNGWDSVELALHGHMILDQPTAPSSS